MFFNFLPFVLATLVGGLAIYILRTVKRLKFFQDHGVPHERPVFLFGNMLPVIFRRKNVGNIVKKLYNTYQDSKYFGFYDFTNPVIVIRDLELVKSVAVKNFESFPDHGLLGPEPRDQLFARNLFNLRGEKWHEVRALLSPAFTSSKMKTMFRLISESTASFVDCLVKDTQGNKTREMKEVFARCTNDVIASCAFGIGINTMKDPNNEFYVLGKQATNLDKLSPKILFMREFPSISKLFDIRLLNSRIDKFFTETIRMTISSRDSMGITRPDMLQLLMDARSKEKKVDLTPEEITAQAFVFYFGGFDTTSTIMSFIAHELAVNPDIQKRLQDKIDSVLRETNSEPTYDVINGIEYLDAVINEALRMYPVLSVLDRVCTKRFQLPATVPGAKPVTVEPGTTVWIPAVGYHYDPIHFEEPEKFNPDRFMKNGTASNKAATFLAFGIGPRQCIGNRFALLETKTVFFNLLARCNLKVCPKTSVPLKLSKKSLGFNASDGYWMQVENRENNLV